MAVNLRQICSRTPPSVNLRLNVDRVSCFIPTSLLTPAKPSGVFGCSWSLGSIPRCCLHSKGYIWMCYTPSPSCNCLLSGACPNIIFPSEKKDVPPCFRDLPVFFFHFGIQFVGVSPLLLQDFDEGLELSPQNQVMICDCNLHIAAEISLQFLLACQRRTRCDLDHKQLLLKIHSVCWNSPATWSDCHGRLLVICDRDLSHLGAEGTYCTILDLHE